MSQFLLFRLRRESDLYLIQHHTLFNPICDINNVWSRSESQISWNKLFLTVWTWHTVSFAYFCLNYPCSPAAIGFPVAKATSFHACGTALQKYEGNLLTSQLIFFVFVLDAYSAIFTVFSTAACDVIGIPNICCIFHWCICCRVCRTWQEQHSTSDMPKDWTAWSLLQSLAYLLTSPRL